MSSRRNEGTIVVHLRIAAMRKSLGHEMPHVALANLPYKKKMFKHFVRRWGEPEAGIAAGVRNMQALRAQLRAAWRGNKDALVALSQRFYCHFEFSKRRVDLELGGIHSAVSVLFLRDYFAGRTGVCANADCLMPFFIRKRSTQKYCEAGSCVQLAQREYKRQWWIKNRAKEDNK